MDGRGSTRCGADLTQVPLREATDAMVIAQAGLTKLVTEGQAHFGIYAERPQTAEPVLHDIRLVGRAAGKALEIAGRGQAVIGDELAAAYMKARKQTETSKDVDRRLRSGVESALGYLALCDPEDVMSLARDFIPAATPYGSHTPELQRLLVAAGGVHRQRTAYLQRRRTVNATNPEDRARRVPARLWSEWAERLNPRPGSTPEHAAETLSVAILAAGVGSPTSQVAPLLGRDTPGAKQLSYLLQGLRRGEHAGERILHAIGECAEYLDTHASPIDYARRRKLDYSNLLPATAWQGVCEAAGVSPGGERTRLIAFAHLFRTLTGSPTRWAWSFEQARGYMTPLVVDAFASTLPPEVQAALDEIGASFLSSNGVNEPLTWTPSLDPVRDLEPPAKTGLGEERTRTRGVAPRAWNPSRPMRGVLDTESIAQQYARGVTTYELAKSANVSRQTISRTLRDAGEESRKGRRATFAIGPDWLRQKYITEQRTIPQIAEEVGCTPMTINRLLHEHQIPVRPRGSGSEARSLRPDDAAGDSTLLQHVLVGRTGVQSAHRFLTVARHGTIGEAATEIGVKGSSLSVQMSKLAERAGGPLINHAERGRPLTLTPLGQQLAKELRERYPDGT